MITTAKCYCWTLCRTIHITSHYWRCSREFLRDLSWSFDPRLLGIRVRTGITSEAMGAFSEVLRMFFRDSVENLLGEFRDTLRSCGSPRILQRKIIVGCRTIRRSIHISIPKNFRSTHGAGSEDSWSNPGVISHNSWIIHGAASENSWSIHRAIPEYSRSITGVTPENP